MKTKIMRMDLPHPMSRKRKGNKGSRGMTITQSSILYSLGVAILLTVLIWSLSPFDQGWHISIMIGTSITLFGIYGIDKAQAKKGGHRTPEKVLHGMALIGGFLGGFVGMYFFRHKTKKIQFLILIIISAVLHVTLYLIL